MERNVDSIRYLYSDSAWYEDDQIWVSSMEFNGLYRYSIKDDKINYIGSFPNEENQSKRLHSKTIKIKKEIYFLPDWSKYVHVYNIETGIFSAYEVGIKGRTGSGNGIYYKEKIYFVCSGTEIMVCSIDTTTKEIRKESIEVKGQVSYDSVLVNDKIYFVCRYPSAIVEYSCGDNSYQKYQIGENEEEFGTICYDGKSFWLSGNAGIVRWTKNLPEIRRYDNYPAGFGMQIRLSLNLDQIEYICGFSNKYSKAEMPFGFSAFWNGKVWLFPGRTNMIICVDIQTGNMEEFFLENEMEDKQSLLAKYRYTHCHYLGSVNNNMLIFFSTKSKKLRIIYQKSTNIKEFYLRCEEPDDIAMYLCGRELDIRYEDEDLNSLEEFLKINYSTNHNNRDNKKSVGALIHEITKRY